MLIQFKLKTSTPETLYKFKKYIIFLLKKNNLNNLKLALMSLPNRSQKFTFLKAPCVHKTALTQ